MCCVCLVISTLCMSLCFCVNIRSGCQVASKINLLTVCIVSEFLLQRIDKVALCCVTTPYSSMHVGCHVR